MGIKSFRFNTQYKMLDSKLHVRQLLRIVALLTSDVSGTLQMAVRDKPLSRVKGYISG